MIPPGSDVSVRGPRPWAESTAGRDLRPAGAAVAFMVLFPGFLLYHYGVSAGWWPALLGGLFGTAAALIAVVALVAILLQWHRPVLRPTIVHVLFLTLLTHLCVWSALQAPLFRHEQHLGAVLSESVATLAIWLALVFVGAQFPSRAGSLRVLSLLSVVSVLLCFGHAFATLGVPAGPFLAFASAEDAGHSTYQGIGRSVLVIACVAAFSWASERPRSIVVLLVAALLLLALGSRAHFFAVLVSILLYVMLLSLRSETRWIGLGCLALLVVAVASSVDLFLETRASEIIDLASSSSWEGRSGANERALDVIADRPFAGSFGYYLWDASGYAHNILSAWTQYGLIGFLLFAGLLAATLSTSIVGLRRDAIHRDAWTLALHFNVIAIVLAVASEPIMSSVFPALAWGFTLRAMHMRDVSGVATAFARADVTTLGRT